MRIDRRTVIMSVGALIALPARASALASVFYRNPGCACCESWGKAMNTAGIPVEMRNSDNLDAVQAEMQVPENLRGCHVGKVGSYTISGHVPPSDVQRLLREKPEATGLSVPGMPMGSPGMETDGQTEPYEVVLFRADGTRETFARHA